MVYFIDINSLECIMYLFIRESIMSKQDDSNLYENTLINMVVKQIEDDIKSSDFSAIYELMEKVDTQWLEDYLCEDDLNSLKAKYAV